MSRKLELIIEDHSTIVYVDIEDNPRLSDTIPLSGSEGNQLKRDTDGYYVPPTFWEDLRDKPNSTTEEIDDAVSRSEQNASSIEGLGQNKVDKVAGKQLSTEDYSTEEKNKLSGVEAGAQVNTVTSVAGKTGDVTLNKTDVGLSSVDNTSDSDKPVSTPQQAALDLKLDADANAVSASKLATPRTISLSGDASGSTSFDGSANATIVVQVADDSHNHVIGNVDGLQTALDSKVDKVVGKQLSDENYTLAEKNKLAGLENYDDTIIINRLDDVDDTLDTKVDKVAGKGLSTNDLTDPLYDKLVGLEGTHWRGTFPSLSALQSGVTDPQAGDYADVDVVGEDVQRYIWDATDSAWVAQSGEVAPITAAQVKMLYESNPDTNAFKDSEKDKLEGIEDGATANSADSYLLNRANHTGVQEIGTIAGLEASLNSKADQTSLDAVAASKVDKVAGKGLSDENYTLAEKNKLSGIEVGATANATDAQLRDRATHTGVQPINTVSGLQGELDSINLLIGDIASALDSINGEVV